MRWQKEYEALSDTLGVHPLAVVLIRYRQLIRMAVRGVGFYALGVGLATFWGGDIRMEGPSYSTAKDVAVALGASPAAFWGIAAMIAGGMALARPRKVSLWGLYGIVAWSLLFAGSFLVSVNTHPLAGVSGPWAHGFIAVMATGLIVMRMVDRGLDRV